jgi:pimeloyl-ACP methyl ester carboxylesterase
MTVEQFISDLDELVDTVCRRCGKNKVTIFGHSWGSAFGTLYASRFPDKVAAYVGCGQMGNSIESEIATYAFALAEAERRGNRYMIQELQKIGPPPHDCDQLCKQQECLVALEGDMTLRQLWKLIKIFVCVPESSVLELFRIRKVLRFSIDTMWTEVTQLNLMKSVPELKMPTFFFLGRQDHCVPSEVSVGYIDKLISPLKEVVWFENSKHKPFMEEPEKFNALMEDLVRPASV